MTELSQLALKYFKLQLPCTLTELKSAYRKAARDCHPDLFPGNEVKEEQFKKMQKAYDLLTSRPEILKESAADIQPKTMDGTPLTSLGLGVEDGVECTTCVGKGYTTVQADPFIQCTTCKGSGFSIPCSKCMGRGVLRDRRRCSYCSGTGHIGLTGIRGISSRLEVCRTCSGSGGFKATKPLYKHFKCGDCDGKGQRPMFNPMWPKMRVGR